MIGLLTAADLANAIAWTAIAGSLAAFVAFIRRAARRAATEGRLELYQPLSAYRDAWKTAPRCIERNGRLYCTNPHRTRPGAARPAQRSTLTKSNRPK